MKKLIAGLIAQYGNDVVITHGEEIYRTKAFLQLVTSKSWQNMERMIPTIGEVPRGQFLYLGSPEIPLNGYDSIETDGRVFIVRRADAILYRSNRLFVWGLCVEGGAS